MSVKFVLIFSFLLSAIYYSFLSEVAFVSRFFKE